MNGASDDVFMKNMSSTRHGRYARTRLDLAVKQGLFGLLARWYRYAVVARAQPLAPQRENSVPTGYCFPRAAANAPASFRASGLALDRT